MFPNLGPRGPVSSALRPIVEANAQLLDGGSQRVDYGVQSGAINVRAGREARAVLAPPCSGALPVGVWAREFGSSSLRPKLVPRGAAAGSSSTASERWAAALSLSIIAQQSSQVEDDTAVTVSGTVREYLPGEIERDHGWFDESWLKPLDIDLQERPVLFAEAVETRRAPVGEQPSFAPEAGAAPQAGAAGAIR